MIIVFEYGIPSDPKRLVTKPVTDVVRTTGFEFRVGERWSRDSDVLWVLLVDLRSLNRVNLGGCDQVYIRWTPGACPCELGDYGDKFGLLTEWITRVRVVLKWVSEVIAGVGFGDTFSVCSSRNEFRFL